MSAFTLPAVEPTRVWMRTVPYPDDEPDGAEKSLRFAAPAVSQGVTASPAQRDEFLVQHLPTVRLIARRMRERLPQQVELDDLVSAGMVGLIDAYSKFDHTKQVQFTTYAKFRIRGAILDSLRALDWGSRELRHQRRAVDESISTLTQRHGHLPSENEIAADLGMTLTRYQQLLGEIKGLEITSLNAPCDGESGDEELASVMAPPEENPLLLCQQGEMRQHLADALAQMEDRERMVLVLHYFQELSMVAIGKMMSLSLSRVSQLHASGVQHLRCLMVAFVPPVDRRKEQVPFAGPDRRKSSLRVVAAGEARTPWTAEQRAAAQRKQELAVAALQDAEERLSAQRIAAKFMAKQPAAAAVPERKSVRKAVRVVAPAAAKTDGISATRLQEMLRGMATVHDGARPKQRFDPVPKWRVAGAVASAARRGAGRSLAASL